jgi:2-amino-4-hydroxy-6-hydroxymethyldihydropteridine diphosphokinase
MEKMNRVLLSIGGNEGDREANLEEARMFISFNMGDAVKTSEVVETEAWGMPEGTEPFLNQLVEIETKLTLEKLYEEILELEEYYGRTRKEGVYLDREMDVDVIFFNDEIVSEGKIIVPHERMHLREFILKPLAATWPEWIHPQMKMNAAQLLAELNKKED